MSLTRGLLLVSCVVAAGCGGRAEGHGGGRAGTAGSSAGGTGLVMTTPGGPMGASGGLPNFGGQPGVGGQVELGGQPGVGGNPNSPDGCSLTWWGGTLAGVTGLRTCAEPYDPAILAYGQTVIDACKLMTGPLGQRTDGDTVSCLYHLDERGCGNDYQSDFWLDLPVFGDGSAVVEVPKVASRAGCMAPTGAPSDAGSTSDRARQLLGVWLLCEGGGTSVGDAVVFYADGSYRALATDAFGNVSPALGCGRFGLWGFLPNTDQLNLYTNDGAAFAHTKFYDGNPRRMVFSDGGEATYVAVN